MTCTCEIWRKSWPQIEGAQIFAHSRGNNYTGEIFNYCPWCGIMICRDVKPDTWPLNVSQRNYEIFKMKEAKVLSKDIAAKYKLSKGRVCEIYQKMKAVNYYVNNNSRWDFKLSLRNRNALMMSGVEDFKQLLTLSDADLLAINNIGRHGLKEIKKFIEETLNDKELYNKIVDVQF